ncbi:1-hydroxycarotenoid 3,4-desaturase CrtD [Jannaschia sp. CCS1]|uniref:1-hydroxycarotenoid 3,4-desaturase CrtD n=1 Tax=Jannaschia sp. (strain CCS1) TaxID=290400 RepID=UPI000053B3FF|nr:methoxyneurosporene dehydrogenase [Jannaschia sp. CCS1]
MEGYLLGDSAHNAVVIGAGIGGLSAALRLAARGVRVTVVEMADAPGGKIRTAPSAAGPVDIGPTVLTMRPVFEALFADVGERLADHVTLHKDPLLARHFWRDGSTLDLYDDPDASIAAVHAFAGSKAARQFQRFASSAKQLYEAFDGPIMQSAAPALLPLTAHVLKNPKLIPAMMPGLSLARRLRLSFDDPRLRQLFGRYATYVGGSPYQSPAVLGLIWHSEAQGVWSVEGGMHALARALHDLAVAKGVQFQFGVAVDQITQHGGSVSGVHLADGTHLAAGTVVFNGDPRALSKGLLEASAIPHAGTEPRSLSAFVWGFAAEPSGVELAHHNVFFCDDPKLEFGDLAKDQMPRDATLYVCAQDRGITQPNGPERFEIIMNGPPGHKTSEEAEKTCQTRTFETLQQMGLTFSPRPERHALTTPKDFNQAFPASDGSLYGRSPHGMMATFQRPTARTTVKGLYLAGGGAHPGAGVPMACLSGKHAAEAILTDLALTSTSPRTATPGGTSMGSATMANRPSPSSAS